MSSSLPTSLLEKLDARFGTRFAASQTFRVHHAPSPSNHLTAFPDAVVFAENTEEVADSVRICVAEGVPVVAVGAGTSLDGHSYSTVGRLVINLSRMSKIIHFNGEDLSCTVQAGATREQINQHLRDTGLFFAVDPGANASIGGMASTRASGTCAVRYGTMSENVLGLTVVLPSGRVIRTAGRVRKHAGYDLTRLFIGAEGTLGIITEVTLRLHVIPEDISAAVCTFESIEEAVSAAIEIVQLGIPVARMELMDRALISSLNTYFNLSFMVEHTLAFEFHGSPGSVEEQIHLVAGVAEENGGKIFERMNDPNERTQLWAARHHALYAVLSQRPNSKAWLCDVCVPVSQLRDCIFRTAELLRACPLPSAIFGPVGNGNYHVVFAVDPESQADMHEAAVIKTVIARNAISVGGTMSEHGVGADKLACPCQEDSDAVELMRIIKTAIDPADIMNSPKILSHFSP
ncbi:FAD-linked oxidase C-terminal domain-containing protein [Neorhizobium sp. S3-V5DH]|uniref:FAD-binding oxidoreductase n=1 Tax=Neorhizobium sp. S3-V5DH TaxID=2485166 RepID=UPI00104898DC|nr:FAD-linked oxidase C-terminal domain-containing protein [Neorhizobium sp. S3-V5DH]TCV68670.1 D-lactate dehydrogenase (cytochrome) [Neorhizobium sp. S3-V5DH]